MVNFLKEQLMQSTLVINSKADLCPLSSVGDKKHFSVTLAHGYFY